MEKSKSGSPAQEYLILRQRHVNAVFCGECGGGTAAEYRIDGRKQRPCNTSAERIWPLRVQGCAPVHPVRRTKATACHRLRCLFFCYCNRLFSCNSCFHLYSLPFICSFLYSTIFLVPISTFLLPCRKSPGNAILRPGTFVNILYYSYDFAMILLT